MSIRRVACLGARVAVACLLALSLLAARPGAAQETRTPRDPSVAPQDRLPVLVERLRMESAERRTMEADFTHRKESTLLKEPLEATGVFSYQAPDRARWEFLEPEAVSLVIRGDEMITWYRDAGRAERYQVGKQSQKVLEYLGASTSIIALLEYFDVFLHMPEDVEAPYRLKLEPRFKRIEKRITELEIWIEPERYLPVRLRYVEPDGDVTDYRFDNFRINEEIAPERFELGLPAGIEIEDRRLGQDRSGG
jgi:outer membrane lipoprotein-sorting protein